MGTDTITRPDGTTIANPMALRFASSSRKAKIKGKVLDAKKAEDERIRRLKAIQSPELTRPGEATTGRKQLLTSPVDTPVGRKSLLGQ